jgi:hypothetical protein
MMEEQYDANLLVGGVLSDAQADAFHLTTDGCVPPPPPSTAGAASETLGCARRVTCVVWE